MPDIFKLHFNDLRVNELETMDLISLEIHIHLKINGECTYSKHGWDLVGVRTGAVWVKAQHSRTDARSVNLPLPRAGWSLRLHKVYIIRSFPALRPRHWDCENAPLQCHACSEHKI